MPKNCTGCGVQIPGDSKGTLCKKCLKNPQPQAQVAAVQRGVIWQNANRVEASGATDLAAAMTTCVPAMHRWLTAQGHWRANAATGLDDQTTPAGCDAGNTLTLDFQGIRAGTNETFWIDIQAQKGGSGDKRKTYGQVMIQTNMASGRPTANELLDVVRQAIAANKQRAVVLDEDEEGRPR